MINQPAVLCVEFNGLWLCMDGGKHFLPFTELPWFSTAPVSAVFNVEPLGREGVRWPDLDVDLSFDSISPPNNHHLVSRQS